jgi:hypothetical protein
MSKEYYGYYGDVWYLYFALLFRTDIEPKKVMKIGVTNARDPMLRLTFKRWDEPHPILNYFPDIQLIKYRAYETEWEAKKNERRIMGMVKREFKSPFFHNWREEDRISGITEMRIWKYIEQFYIENIF